MIGGLAVELEFANESIMDMMDMKSSQTVGPQNVFVLASAITSHDPDRLSEPKRNRKYRERMEEEDKSEKIPYRRPARKLTPATQQFHIPSFHHSTRPVPNASHTPM